MNFLTSPILEALPHLYHGFGMRSEEGVSGIVFPKQVHGNRVEVINTPVSETWHEPADAVIMTCPGLPVGVKTADCLPILMAEESGKGVAVVHAGWRGIAMGVLPKTLRRFMEVLDVRPGAVYLAVGPGIGACCMEVDEPVKKFFGEHGQQDIWARYARAGRSGHWQLDLQAMAKTQALEEGVKEAHIDVLSYCTCCDADYFYSYRREGLAAGRQVNYICFKEREK